MTKVTTDKDFKKDVLESELPVLVDFWAQWCGPCRFLAPILDQIASEYQGRLKVFKINIDENPDSPTLYQVRGIPNLILFNKGEIVSTKVGALPKPSLQNWLDSNLK